MNPKVDVANSRGVDWYIHEAAQYQLLTHQEEGELGRRLRGEASLDILVSSETFLFARDYAAHAAVLCSASSQFAKDWLKYTQAYPCSGNGSLDAEVDVLRHMYRKDLSHYDGFVATTARYLMRLEEYAHRVSPPVWRTAWKKQEAAFVAIRKKKNPCMVLTFSSDIQQAAEHPDAQKALYQAYRRLYYDAVAAQDRFVTSNLLLVVSIAKEYINKGVEFEDIIQFGNLGLIKSLEKFESTRYFKFSTYASYWIRQSIFSGMQDTARTIRVPMHALETINRLMKLQKEYTQLLGREPAAAEFRVFAAEKLRISPDKVDKLLLRRKRFETISLDDSVNAESDPPLEEFYTVPAHAESSLPHAQPQAIDLSYDECQLHEEIYAWGKLQD
ncbi:MAG: sigma-70 family RNA polymerase sigma factor, partial [Nanoarchaeota archaeon]